MISIALLSDCKIAVTIAANMVAKSYIKKCIKMDIWGKELTCHEQLHSWRESLHYLMK
jgi:hypothetical protein